MGAGRVPGRAVVAHGRTSRHSARRIRHMPTAAHDPCPPPPLASRRLHSSASRQVPPDKALSRAAAWARAGDGGAGDPVKMKLPVAPLPPQGVCGPGLARKLQPSRDDVSDRWHYSAPTPPMSPAPPPVQRSHPAVPSLRTRVRACATSLMPPPPVPPPRRRRVGTPTAAPSQVY